MTNVRLSQLACALSVVTTALLSSACDRSFDVTWTVQGQPAGEGCDGVGDSVRLIAETRDNAEAPPRRAEAVATCTDGMAKISAGSNAQLLVELLRGEVVVGSAEPITLTSASESPLAVDLAVHTGELAATLTVAGLSCEEAGANRFSVKLLADVGGLEARVIDEKEVACEGGVARYTHPAVKIGSRYLVDASTTIGDELFEVSGLGHAVRIDHVHTEATVDLRSSVAQPGRDAGPPGFIDGGEPSDDAGDEPVDAGDDEDAGSEEPDAGADPADAGYDAGADPVDAGYDAGSDEDAGDGDAGDGDAGDAGDETCVPVCAIANACGDDGCGGSCGTCSGLTPNCSLGVCGP